MKDYHWLMKVETVEEAIVVVREMLKDLCGYGWLDICGDDLFGQQIKDALVILLREYDKQ